MTDNINLVQRLAKATAEVGGKLKADKRNAEQGYNYVSADKILAACGQALADNGIVVIPSIVKQEINVIDRGNNKFRYDATVDLCLKVTDGVSSFEEPWYGMGSDYSVPDKALYKAITSGHKYFLSKLFCIGEGNEDGEHENGEDQPAPRPAQARPSNSKPAPEAPKPTAPAAPVVVDAPALTLEEALNTTNRDGELYGSLSTEKLSLMANAITKKLRGSPVTAEERAESERKYAAIDIILKSRQQ
jgi:hypothetical protein